MTTSRSTGQSPPKRTFQQTPARFSRYDLMLAAIPAVFGVALVVSLFASIPLQAAIGVGALLSCGCLVDALYLNPPVPADDE